jgi:iron(II)-dependent oxidoreductase
VVLLFWPVTYYVYAQPRANLSKTITSIKDGAPMVLIPKGQFVSGMNRSALETLRKQLREPWAEIYAREFPKTTKMVDDFYIDRYEVTNAFYVRFVKATRHRESAYSGFRALNRPRQPIVGVGWDDAEQYCRWAGKRLPTEIEWEKAARGTDGRIWPWGNDPDGTKYNGRKVGIKNPVEVGSFPTGNSLYGVSDMAGNVWEMTSSKWPDEKNPDGRVMKGGSFLNPILDVRVMVRWAAQDEKAGATWLGFRCVMDTASVQKSARPG